MSTNSLPAPPEPAGNYLPAVAFGGVVYTAGMTPRSPDGMMSPGTVGAEVSLDQARDAAAYAALRALSAAAAAVGGLGQIRRILKLTVLVACTPGFGAQSAVGDGASDALIELLGENGQAARTACGVRALPSHACVEVELVAAYDEPHL